MRRPTNSYSGPPHGTGYLSRPVLRLLARTGGIVSTRELAAIGVDPTTLELYRDRGSLQAVRQGWHCHPSVPDVMRLAWRFGGPLACLSALAFHEALSTGIPITTTVIGAPLHVCLRDNAVGAPAPALLARRWGLDEPLEPVIHWSSRAHRSGDRRAVARTVALRQADRCSSS
ncbi:MAG: type IV toxin-antitoxin system AbiEi family antitoxin domain-containing protein [Microbacteriaceae bacterium]|nr:type IV toxin-antitoxin system AbiEi family antitoxin domain-containing protein [Microbacteriaceae bacterium]